MPHTIISMSQKEVDRYDIIKRVIRKELKGVEAAKLLGLSSRQVKRLKMAVKKHQAKGLIHGNRGKPSNRRIPESEREKIVEILKNKYGDFKPTHASEKLSGIHNLTYDPKTIRAIQIAEGLWKQRRGKKKRGHRSWRPRKERYGQMQQFDGSYHDWFEGRDGIGEACLLLSIDDARGKITKAKFDAHEGVFPVFGFWKEYILAHGKPRSIYVDKYSTYKMNQKVAVENHETRTQFQRAMESLHIEDISAHSPEAKGRVERVFETLQDRLVKEMRLAGVNTWEEGNRYLEEIFIPWFNKRYAVEAAESGDLHQPLTVKEKNRIDSIFSRHTSRVVHNDFTISFDKTWHQLTKQQPVTVCKKDKVTVEKRLDGRLHIRLRDKSLNYEILPERPKRSSKTIPWVLGATQEKPKALQSFKKPAHDHPWRQQARAHIHTSQNTH